MEVELKKQWPLAVATAQAWAVLADVRAVAACMPGAQITEQVDATHFKGQVRSKVGPAVMMFGGDIEVLALDAKARTMEMLGKGADKGGSTAQMRLVARLAAGADAASCVLEGDATVTISGKLAQFGGRLLVPIADAMLAQFAENFRAAAAAQPASDASPIPREQSVADLPSSGVVEPTRVAALAREVGVGDAEPASGNESTASTAIAGPRSDPPPQPLAKPAAPVKELNALSLAWAVLRGWFLGLFGKKAT